MIRYLYGDQLVAYPSLRDSMFRDRAQQFSSRLHWDVQVSADGFETDEYDGLNPLYVIHQNPDGTHGGSMRFLPTTGRVMVNEHFLDLIDGVEITSPLIWESTRFCLSHDGEGPARISASLMLAGAALGRRFHLAHAVGVFDARMVRVYRRLGWPPEIVGTKCREGAAISVGLWDFAAAPIADLCRNAQVSAQTPERWFNQSFCAGAAM